MEAAFEQLGRAPGQHQVADGGLAPAVGIAQAMNLQATEEMALQAPHRQGAREPAAGQVEELAGAGLGAEQKACHRRRQHHQQQRSGQGPPHPLHQKFTSKPKWMCRSLSWVSWPSYQGQARSKRTAPTGDSQRTPKPAPQ